MKISDTTVIQELNKPRTTYTDWKKREPRAIELIKKGLLAEKLLNKKVFEENIKKNNKR